MTNPEKHSSVDEMITKMEYNDVYREQFIENIMNHPHALELLQALEPRESKRAASLVNTLERAASIAETKDWGAESAVQWQAGHMITVELLRAIAAGEETHEVVEKWADAAELGEDIISDTRAQRNGNMPRFQWDPMAGF